jgi:hypothetical protein
VRRLAALAAVVAAAAACTSGGGTDVIAGTRTPPCPDLSVLDRVEGVDPGPSDESLEPVVVGFVNPDTATGSAAGFDAAIDLVNACLGGIEGHPVESRVCVGGADAVSADACAAQLAADPQVHVVATGAVPASAALLPRLDAAGKAVALSAPVTTAELASPTAAAIYPGRPGSLGALVAYATEQLDARRITAVVLGDENGVRDLELLGLAVAGTRAALVGVGVGPADADNAPALTAVPGALDADVVVALVPPEACDVLAQSLAMLEVEAPIVSTGACADVDGWYVVGDTAVDAAGGDLEEEATLLRAGLRRSGAVGPDEAGVAASFGTGLALWEIGVGIGFGDSSPPAWAAALRASTAPALLGTRALSCGAVPGLPALCGTEAWVRQVGPDGGAAEAVRAFAS